MKKLMIAFLIGISFNAMATPVEVYPNRNYIGKNSATSTEKVSIFTISGESFKKTRIYEIKINKRTNDSSVETNDLMVSPQVVVVKPGEKKTVRFWSTKGRSEKQEMYYVDFMGRDTEVENLPNVVKVNASYRIPIFVEPTTEKKVFLKYTEEKDYTTIKNEGNTTLQIKPYSKDGKEIISNTYLIPNQEIRVNKEAVDYIKSIENKQEFIP